MKIIEDIKLDFDDVLIKPRRSPNSSRQSVNISRNFCFYYSNRGWNGTPIMAANMDSTGTFAMANSLSSLNIITCLHKHYDEKVLIEFFSGPIFKNIFKIHTIWLSIGITDKDIEKIKYLKDNIKVKDYLFPNICIDIANGYSDKFVEKCEQIRNIVGYSPIIMAGNVCTPEMVQELIIHGKTDIVKIGIGPGKACTTRMKTGVGYPQLSAIIECADAAHGLKSGDKQLGLICADGGCRTSGDINKAFGAGADFVMLGSMLAGTDECDGKWITDDIIFNNGSGETVLISKGNKKISFKFYGMASKEAQEKHGNGVPEYGTEEGQVITVPYKGPVSKVIKNILGGIRSGCLYIGSDCIKDMNKCTTFIRVNRIHV